MTEADPNDFDLPDDLGEIDRYTLEFSPHQFERVKRWASGKVVIEQTPEQREEFLDFMEEYLAAAGRSVSPEQEAEQ